MKNISTSYIFNELVMDLRYLMNIEITCVINYLNFQEFVSSTPRFQFDHKYQRPA